MTDEIILIDEPGEEPEKPADPFHYWWDTYPLSNLSEVQDPHDPALKHLYHGEKPVGSVRRTPFHTQDLELTKTLHADLIHGPRRSWTQEDLTEEQKAQVEKDIADIHRRLRESSYFNGLPIEKNPQSAQEQIDTIEKYNFLVQQDCQRRQRKLFRRPGFQQYPIPKEFPDVYFFEVRDDRKPPPSPVLRVALWWGVIALLCFFAIFASGCEKHEPLALYHQYYGCRVLRSSSREECGKYLPPFQVEKFEGMIRRAGGANGTAGARL